MSKQLALASVFALAVSGCASRGGLSAGASNDVTSVLAVACPALSATQALNAPLNAHQRTAAAALALACPPNPAPTSAVIAVADLISAYATLRPLLK